MPSNRFEQAVTISKQTDLSLTEAIGIVAQIVPAPSDGLLDDDTLAALGATPVADPMADPTAVCPSCGQSEASCDCCTYCGRDCDCPAPDGAAYGDDEPIGVTLRDPDPETEDADTSELITGIRTLLADQFTVYYRAHSAHWNVKGPAFGAYHELFGKIAEDLYGAVDPIAEELLKLDTDAPCCFEELFENGSIVAQRSYAQDPAQLSIELVGMIEALIEVLETVFDYATDCDEQGVANLLADRIDATRKHRWQLRASIS